MIFRIRKDFLSTGRIQLLCQFVRRMIGHIARKFSVFKSVNYHTFKWINQPDAEISQVYCLSFKYRSTCFGHLHAHHWELNCSSRLWFTFGTLGEQCCWSWSVRSDRPRPTALLPPRSNGKPESATAAELLMMGMKMLETCWSVFKRQATNLRNCCIWLVDSFECLNIPRN